MEGVDYSTSRTKGERKKNVKRIEEKREFISPRMLFCLSPSIHLLPSLFPSSTGKSFSRQPSLSCTALRSLIRNLKGHETSILVGEVFGWKNEKKEEPREASRVMRTPGMTKRSQKFQQLLSFNVHLLQDLLPFYNPHLDLRSSTRKEDKGNEWEKGERDLGLTRRRDK